MSQPSRQSSPVQPHGLIATRRSARDGPRVGAVVAPAPSWFAEKLGVNFNVFRGGLNLTFQGLRLLPAMARRRLSS
jgi:hypothetical protein